MENTRQQKIERFIQKEMSDIFLLFARNLKGTLITVASVHVSADLSIAHINLSIFPSNKDEETLNVVNLNAKNLRFELGNKVRHQLRIIPQLVYHIDDTLDYQEHIDDLLKK